jgi:hypothetical protein
VFGALAFMRYSQRIGFMCLECKTASKQFAHDWRDSALQPTQDVTQSIDQARLQVFRIYV